MLPCEISFMRRAVFRGTKLRSLPSFETFDKSSALGIRGVACWSLPALLSKLLEFPWRTHVFHLWCTMHDERIAAVRRQHRMWREIYHLVATREAPRTAEKEFIRWHEMTNLFNCFTCASHCCESQMYQHCAQESANQAYSARPLRRWLLSVILTDENEENIHYTSVQKKINFWLIKIDGLFCI